ncbi:hypothetical protein A5643_10985 [Mycobacterium sp. 1274756.6]|nr:hypothetical protein A5643_10985 [Mycobacterium sp. 1274756.6]
MKISGAVQRDALEWAIRRVIQETEPVRVAFTDLDGQVRQTLQDYPDVELVFCDLRGAEVPMLAAREAAADIQRTPMALTGPLFKFALFQTGAAEYCFFGCGHHIVADGTAIALIGHRIAAVYTAAVTGEPIPPAFFGTLSDFVTGELEYEESTDYLDDEAYWTKCLSALSESDDRSPKQQDGTDLNGPTAPVELDASLLRRVDELADVANVPRTAVLTAACALLVRGWCSGGPEVVLDFPVTRRVSLESKTLPAMLAGVVPLVLEAAPDASVLAFCEHVGQRIREAVRHQRFPVQALERKLREFRPGELTNRVNINFLPSTFTLDFGGATATAELTNIGLVGGFGLIFSSAGNQLFLSTMGAGQPFADFADGELVSRLERVLVAMVADPGRLVSSVGVVDEAESARLDGLGHRSVLTRPVVGGVSIPELFGVQVVRAPGAVALRCGGVSWTYQQLDEASNRWAHLLAEYGARPGGCVALVVERSAVAVAAVLGVLKTGAGYVPVDVGLPAGRVLFMLADAAPVVVVAGGQWAGRLAGSWRPAIGKPMGTSVQALSFASSTANPAWTTMKLVALWERASSRTCCCNSAGQSTATLAPR